MSIAPELGNVIMKQSLAITETRLSIVLLIVLDMMHVLMHPFMVEPDRYSLTVMELFINCHGEGACSDADIRTRASTLIDAQGERSLYYADIRCNTTEYCNITAEGYAALALTDIYADIVSGTKLFVSATGGYALYYTNIRCPIDDIRGDSYSNDALCIIYAQGDEVMKGTKIYAVESFYNAHIECDTRQSTNSGGISFLYCAEFALDQFCELHCPQNDTGIEFVDESNCFCGADYILPTPQPTPNCIGDRQCVNCIGDHQCYHETITCDHGNAAVNCTIDCIGYDACSYASIYGGAGPLFINCH
eukprot:643829_1